MEQENQAHTSKTASAMRASDGPSWPNSPAPRPHAEEPRDLNWFFVGNHGLRAGWSVLIAVILYRFFSAFLGTATVVVCPAIITMVFSPAKAIIDESIPFLAMLAAGMFVARIEQRRILDFNLSGPRRSLHFFSGLAAGFLALSALVSAMAWGGWLHFGPISLSGAAIYKFGVIWAIVFLVVGCVEEGIFRCYLQFTLTRGINFWWALGIVGVLCLDLVLRAKGNVGIIAFIWLDTLPVLKGSCYLGVYAVGLLGLIPCTLLHLSKGEGSGFWQAAWVTSTLFGFIHTGNGGENWIGIFAAAGIGFVFCVGIRVTGSAWWAIGCHAAWDWAETYFYGTADSGLVATGHCLTTSTRGNPLWSGGADGPEGSLLVIGIILLLLLALLALYGRRKPAPLAVPPPIGSQTKEATP